MKTVSWTVKFTIDECWITDGFELTKDMAKDMIENALPFSKDKVKVLVGPPRKYIRKAQGYNN